MDAVKAKSSPSVQATQAPKRMESKQQSQQVPSPDAVVAKNAAESAPRPTTNTRGETLGRRLNVTA